MKPPVRPLRVLFADDEASLQELVVEVYRDVDPQLHGVATRSLLAHLIKLQDDGRTQESSGRWRWIN